MQTKHMLKNIRHLFTREPDILRCKSAFLYHIDGILHPSQIVGSTIIGPKGELHTCFLCFFNDLRAGDFETVIDLQCYSAFCKMDPKMLISSVDS